MAGMLLFAGATIASTLLQLEGNRREARAKEVAAQREADVKEAQANELLERFQINRKIMLRQSEEVKGAQRGAFAKGGVDVSSGSTLLALEETNRIVTESINLENMEVESQAAALRAGAIGDREFGESVRKSEKLQRAGILLSGASSVGAAGLRGAS